MSKWITTLFFALGTATCAWLLSSQAVAQEKPQRGLEIEQADLRGELYIARPLTADGVFTEGIEGPASDSEGNVYAVNFGKQQTIGKVDRWGNAKVLVTLPGESTGNGIVIDSQGDLLVADYVGHKIWAVDPKSGAMRMVAQEPTMSQPNDLAIADDGTLYASDPDWGGSTGRIWRMSTEGKLRLVADGMGTANGIEVSPGSQWLYVNESVQRRIWRFKIDAEGGLTQKTLFKEFPDHGFDGMRCDQAGNLYVTRYGKGTVVVLDPQGEQIREIDVLGSRPSNLCFGGEDGRTVVVTDVEHGRLVRFRTEVAGRKPKFNDSLREVDWLNKSLHWRNTLAYSYGELHYRASPLGVEAEGKNAYSNPEKQADKVASRLTAGSRIASTTGEEWESESLVYRKRFQQLLGPMPSVGGEPKIEVQSSEQIGGVERRLIKIEVEPGVAMDAYLLIPSAEVGSGLVRNGKRPGIVALHPTTSSTIDEIAGVGEFSDKLYGPRATGMLLAKRGYVVICPKCFLWQDVMSFQEAVDGHRRRHPQARGIAKMVFDARRALDALLTVAQVDHERIGAFGHSLGAKEVLYLMAADPRVLVGVASEGGVAMSSTNWDAPWYLGPAPRLEGEDWSHQELIGLIAPRSLLVMGGEQGPGAADGTQSLQTLAGASKAWDLCEQIGSGPLVSRSGLQVESAEGAQVRLQAGGVGYWNHFEGHVFSERQWEATLWWFDRHFRGLPKVK